MTSRIDELELELEILKCNSDNYGFALSDKQEEQIQTKMSYLMDNKEVIFDFLRWLNRFGINLKLVSFKERGRLLTIYSREQHGFKRKQYERDLLNEVMSRCL